MRSLALVAAIVIVPGTAFAGAVTTLSGNTDTAGSVVSIGTPAPVVTEPAAPQLAPGEEWVQVRHVDGKTKIYRTEAWLGGSPATYVTTATEADLAALKQRGIDVASAAVQTLRPNMVMAAAAEPQGTAVNRQERTGSLTRVPDEAASAAARPLDAASFELRLTMAGAEE